MVFDMRTRGLAARWWTSFVASALFATLLVFAGYMQREAAPAAPSAATTYLCSGYSGCVSAGYSDAGYGAVSGKMYWQMYSGHNCTNYAAYRVIKAGGPATRPWVGNGNASEWGLRLSRMTDQVPTVGAIAWWGRYSNGSGSAGHVAYVERVVSSTEIIISEDSWGGTFHWRRITKSSGRWPTGFIHLVDKAISSKTPPSVTGTPAVGNVLTATNGSWAGSPTSYSYEWFVGGASTGVKTKTYSPTVTDRDKTVTVKVRASRSGYTAAVRESAPTSAVVAGTFKLATPPTVSGEPFVDQVLTASPGTWSPEPKAMAWRWFADGKRLANDTPTLALTPELVGKEISVIPVARRGGYVAADAPRVVAGTVVVGAIETSRPFAVLGKRKLGETLTVRPGTFTPVDAVPAYQWLRDGVPIPGAVGPTYRLTAADVASRVSVQVDLTKPSYAPKASVAAAPGVVRSPATIRIKTSSAGGKAIVRVSVSARGLDHVPGRVWVRVGSWTRTVTLRNGSAEVRVARAPGRKYVAVRYLETAVVPPAHATASVRVR
jgi:surface antigen